MMDGTRAGVELDPDLQRVVSLLPTPQTVNRKSERAMRSSSEDGGNGRRSGGGQSSPPGLEQVVERLLPTPRSRDKGVACDYTAGEGGPNLMESVRALLPTPRTTDGTDAPANRSDYLDRVMSGEEKRSPRLSEMALYMTDNAPLLPTPPASKVTDEDAESWRTRQREGKVATMPLSLAVRTAGETEKPGEPGEGEGSWGTGQMLPTPTSQAAKHGAPTPWEVARREVQPGNLWETVADLAERGGTSASSPGLEG